VTTWRRRGRSSNCAPQQGEQPDKIIARVSQGTLAEMIGTTRSRLSFFMNKLRNLGFIKYNGGLQVNDSLLRVLLCD
jgi:hypothetical protein